MVRWHIGLISGTVLCLALLLGCGGAQTAQESEFWQEARADALILLEPQIGLPAPGTLTVHEVQAVAGAHVATTYQGADHSLDLQLAAGDRVTLHYRVGAGRKIPVQKGDRLWLTLWQRQTAPLQPPLRAMVLQAERKGQPGAWHPVAVVDVQGLVPREHIPPALQGIEPTDDLVYQVGETVAGECYHAVAHHRFAVPPDLGQTTRLRSSRRVPPGARLQLWDVRDAYDVVLLDNRKIMTPPCPGEPTVYRAWAALWQSDRGAQAPTANPWAR